MSVLGIEPGSWRVASALDCWRSLQLFSLFFFRRQVFTHLYCSGSSGIYCVDQAALNLLDSPSWVLELKVYSHAFYMCGQICSIVGWALAICNNEVLRIRELTVSLVVVGSRGWWEHWYHPLHIGADLGSFSGFMAVWEIHLLCVCMCVHVEPRVSSSGTLRVSCCVVSETGSLTEPELVREALPWCCVWGY